MTMSEIGMARRGGDDGEVEELQGAAVLSHDRRGLQRGEQMFSPIATHGYSC
jgi:hypothetical protein